MRRVRWLVLATACVGCGKGGEAGAEPERADAAETDGAVPPEPPVPWEPPAAALCGRSGPAVFRFESAEQRMVLEFSREILGPGIGESVLFEMTYFGLWRDGRARCVEASGDLEYVNSHHNFGDGAIATTDGVRYELAFRVGGTANVPLWVTTLEARDAATDALAFGPVELLPTGGPVYCLLCNVPAIVSELMTNNVSTLADDHGDHDPWIELANTGSEPIDLAGWSLSNDPRNRRLWTFPSVTLPGQTSLVVFADGQPEQGALHTSFRLDTDGTDLVLTDPTGASTGERTFGPLDPDESWIVAPSTTAEYERNASPSPGALR